MQSELNDIQGSFPGDVEGEMCPHLAHLADAAGLAQSANCPHVALVPWAKFGWVVIGWWVQHNAGMDVPWSLQMVALTEQRDIKGWGFMGNKVTVKPQFCLERQVVFIHPSILPKSRVHPGWSANYKVRAHTFTHSIIQSGQSGKANQHTPCVPGLLEETREPRANPPSMDGLHKAIKWFNQISIAYKWG